jgi:hypothetical protein
VASTILGSEDAEMKDGVLALRGHTQGRGNNYQVDNFCFLVVLGFELRASHLLRRHSIT